MIEDVKCAVRYLRAHSREYNIDPDRIAAIGASAVGEYLDQPSEVQPVIVMSGMSDLTRNIPSGLNGSIYYAFGKLANKDTFENAAVSPSHTSPPMIRPS